MLSHALLLPIPHQTEKQDRRQTSPEHDLVERHRECKKSKCKNLKHEKNLEHTARDFPVRNNYKRKHSLRRFRIRLRRRARRSQEKTNSERKFKRFSSQFSRRSQLTAERRVLESHGLERIVLIGPGLE